MPRVSVGLPFFDEARHLGDAIRSVLAQTERDLELILVDDGSRDGSLEIARAFDDPRIRVVADGRRRHLPARLNEIVRLARAPLVARCDADDVMHPTRLARQLEVLDRDPACDVVGTWAVLVDGTDTPFAVAETPTAAPTARAALSGAVLSHATVVGRRSWFLANPYDESLTRAEDRDLWCRTVETSRFAVIPECLYVVRVDVDKTSFLDGYREAQRQNAIIAARYGPRIVGSLASARMRAAAHAKSAVMAALVKAGLASRLVRRRGRAPTEAEIVLAREALAAASRQRV